ncbi:MAG: hypothetical protein ACREMU_09105 [Gemmatimonadaceae bacterium]
MLAFLEYLDAIDRALTRRDSMDVTSLLRKRIATHLPREVREELIALAHAPRASLRAPVRFLRFQHRMTELARGGERLLTAQTELRLEPRPIDGAIRVDGERRTAALESKSGTGGASDATDGNSR